MENWRCNSIYFINGTKKNGGIHAPAAYITGLDVTSKPVNYWVHIHSIISVILLHSTYFTS